MLVLNGAIGVTTSVSESYLLVVLSVILGADMGDDLLKLNRKWRLLSALQNSLSYISYNNNNTD